VVMTEKQKYPDKQPYSMSHAEALIKHKTKNKKQTHEPCYTSTEVARLLDYSSTTSLHNAVCRDKVVPPPDFVGGISGRGTGVWRKSVIDKLVKERKKLEVK